MEVTLAQRRLDSSYKMVQRWALEFGPTFARNLRRLSQTSDTGRLDEMVLFEPKSDALTALTRGIEVSFDLDRT